MARRTNGITIDHRSQCWSSGFHISLIPQLEFTCKRSIQYNLTASFRAMASRPSPAHDTSAGPIVHIARRISGSCRTALCGAYEDSEGGRHERYEETGFRAGVIAALVSFATLAGAQQQPQPLKVTKIKDNVYWLRAARVPMTGSSWARTGVILVDTKTTVDSKKEVIAEIAKITPKTVNTVIITHSDGDHVNGLAAFPAGLTIIAQENCKKEMEASASSRNPAPQDRLPTKTYDKTDKLTIDGVHIRLYHWAAGAHGGDTIVYLPDQKIVFGGDLLVSEKPCQFNWSMQHHLV